MELENKQTVRSQSSEKLGTFFLASCEFALPVRHIQEVVAAPEKLTKMPLSPAYLVGIFNLRGAVVPVVDTCKILNLDKEGGDWQDKRIAIVEESGVVIGLLFDKTGEVLHPTDDAYANFEYSKAERDLHVVSAALKLDDGKRIVQILDVMALFQLENIPHNLDSNQAQSLRRKKKTSLKAQCISFVVGNSRCAFGINAIQEIIKIPKVSNSVLTGGLCIGMFELRGSIVPLIDFAAVLKFHEPHVRESYSEDERIMILRIGEERFGLLIDSLENILSYHPEDLIELPALTKAKESIFMGCLSREKAGETLLLNHLCLLTDSEIETITRGHSKMFSSEKVAGSNSSKKNLRRDTYLTFRIVDFLAVEIKSVKEIIDYPSQVMNPPGLPDGCLGLVNLRGHLVMLVDGRKLYGQNKSASGEDKKVIVFVKGNVHYGLVVDSIESILTVKEEEKIKIPTLILRNVSERLENDVNFAVEVEVSKEQKTLLVLNLDSLVSRIEFAPDTLVATESASFTNVRSRSKS